MSSNSNFGSILGELAASVGLGFAEAARHMADQTAHRAEPSSEEAQAAAFIGGLSSAASDMFRNVNAAPGSTDASATADWFTGFQHVVQNFVEEHMDGAHQPPTSKSALSSLPVIKVTQKDIESCDSAECVICLEKFQVGDAATRILCGHLFHESCVKQWLSSCNQCPICRFELPSEGQDSPRGRRLRFRASELSARSIRELKHLAAHLNIDVSGCLEKEDVVRQIVTSGLVDIILEEHPVPETKDTAHNVTPALSVSQLRSMRAGDIKAVMKQCGICSEGCLEKEDLIARFAASSFIKQEMPAQFKKGDRVLWRGEAATVMDLDYSLDPPGYEVRTDASDKAVNCEAEHLVPLVHAAPGCESAGADGTPTQTCDQGSYFSSFCRVVH